MLRDPKYEWAPYIEMFEAGDCVEWIGSVWKHDFFIINIQNYITKSIFFAEFLRPLNILILFNCHWIIHTLIKSIAFIESRLPWWIQWISPGRISRLLEWVLLIFNLRLRLRLIERRKFHKRGSCRSADSSNRVFPHRNSSNFIWSRLFRYNLFGSFLFWKCFSGFIFFISWRFLIFFNCKFADNISQQISGTFWRLLFLFFAFLAFCFLFLFLFF